MSVVSIGIDGGGTQTRLLAEGDDGSRWMAEAGAANPRVVGVERSASIVASLIDEAIEGYSEATGFRICAGVAGAATPTMRRALADAVKLDLRHSAGISLELTDDASIAYEAAFEGEPGVLFIIGTGSMILARSVDGTFFRSGGWGYLLGDEGSGYSLGRSGLRAVAASIDADQPTALTTRAAADLEVSTRDELLERVYGSDYSMASFAPAVLEEAEAGDEQAVGIIYREAGQLVDRFRALADRLGLEVPGTVKVTGGLSKSRAYMLALAEIIAERFPGWRVTQSGREPVEGALWLAKRMPD